jgi:hypothetical protein
MGKQRELTKNRNELLISRKAAEQDTEITSLETNYYSHENPGLRRTEAIKQRELAFEKANGERRKG